MFAFLVLCFGLLTVQSPTRSPITPNYVDNSTSNVAPWCTCNASGNRQTECESFLHLFTNNICIQRALLAFGNGTYLESATNPSTLITTSKGKRERNPNRAAATARGYIFDQIPTEGRRLVDSTHMKSRETSHSQPANHCHWAALLWSAVVLLLM